MTRQCAARGLDPCSFVLFFFFNDTATTEIYTLSLHDALPIYLLPVFAPPLHPRASSARRAHRSEEHTSELQSPCNLVCRLLLEKKTNNHSSTHEFGRRQEPHPTGHS